jgi:hypothetical protein
MKGFKGDLLQVHPRISGIRNRFVRAKMINITSLANICAQELGRITIPFLHFNRSDNNRYLSGSIGIPL